MKAAPREIAVVVLAAGQGTRMKSGLAKVLHPLAGRPMLHFPLAAAERLAKALKDGDAETRNDALSELQTRLDQSSRGTEAADQDQLRKWQDKLAGATDPSADREELEKLARDAAEWARQRAEKLAAENRKALQAQNKAAGEAADQLAGEGEKKPEAGSSAESAARAQKALDQAAEHFLEHRVEDAGLVSEVVVDRRGRVAAAARELAHREVLVAVLDEDRARRVQDRALGFEIAPLPAQLCRLEGHRCLEVEMPCAGAPGVLTALIACNGVS